MLTMNIVNKFNDPRIVKGNHNEEELHMMWKQMQKNQKIMSIPQGVGKPQKIEQQTLKSSRQSTSLEGKTQMGQSLGLSEPTKDRRSITKKRFKKIKAFFNRNKNKKQKEDKVQK